MQTGEAAGFAAALARKDNVPPALLKPDRLVRTLAKRGQLMTFFNDVKADSENETAVAAEYFGTLGFLPSYDARLDAPVHPTTAKLWAEALAQLKAGISALDARKLASDITTAESSGTPAILGGRPRGEVLLQMWRELQ